MAACSIQTQQYQTRSQVMPDDLMQFYFISRHVVVYTLSCLYSEHLIDCINSCATVDCVYNSAVSSCLLPLRKWNVTLRMFNKYALSVTSTHVLLKQWSQHFYMHMYIDELRIIYSIYELKIIVHDILYIAVCLFIQFLACSHGQYLLIY